MARNKIYMVRVGETKPLTVTIDGDDGNPVDVGDWTLTFRVTPKNSSEVLLSGDLTPLPDQVISKGKARYYPTTPWSLPLKDYELKIKGIDDAGVIRIGPLDGSGEFGVFRMMRGL